jgi:hypothetical protein
MGGVCAYKEAGLARRFHGIVLGHGGTGFDALNVSVESEVVRLRPIRVLLDWIGLDCGLAADVGGAEEIVVED